MHSINKLAEKVSADIFDDQPTHVFGCLWHSNAYDDNGHDDDKRKTMRRASHTMQTASQWQN